MSCQGMMDSAERRLDTRSESWLGHSATVAPYRSRACPRTAIEPYPNVRIKE